MPIKVRDKQPKPVKPQSTTTTTTTPAPKPPAKLGIPTGTIPTTLKIAYGRGDPWTNVTVDAPFHEKWGAKYGVDPAMLMAMEVVETGGRMIPNAGGSGAYGILQIKESDWGWLAKKLGADLKTREGQIQVAAAILGKEGRGSNPRERFLYSYYPVLDGKGNLCLDCKGEDGGTPRQYLQDIDTLIGIINAAANGITPAEPQGDVIDLLYGGKPYDISAEYGQPVTWQCPIGVNPGQRGNCYEYQRAYGLDDVHHYAYDVSANAGDGAPLYAPFDGLVVCAGTDVGGGAWGTGCAANNRLNNYGGLPARNGAGRLELLNEDGTASLIIGHVLGSNVKSGARVKRGDLIGWQGGQNGSHVHLESRYDNGRRIGDPRKIFGGGPIPTTYAERIPIPQPQEFDTTATVRAVRDGVPVLQRASLDAEPVRKPLEKGEDFEAVYQVIGNDKRIYWVSSLGSRIPVDGTESDEWPG